MASLPHLYPTEISKCLAISIMVPTTGLTVCSLDIYIAIKKGGKYCVTLKETYIPSQELPSPFDVSSVHKLR